MKAEGRWIFTMLAFGALLGQMLHGVVEYVSPGSFIDDIVVWVFFTACLIMSPSYGEVCEYWREKYR